MRRQIPMLFFTPGLTLAFASVAVASDEPLTFSGAVVGSWTQSHTLHCEMNEREGKAEAALAGTVAGTRWTLTLSIGGYKGPGSYGGNEMPNVRVVLDDGSRNPNTWFSSERAGPAKLTVSADGKSGTVDGHLVGETGRPVTVKGAWKC